MQLRGKDARRTFGGSSNRRPYKVGNITSARLNFHFSVRVLTRFAPLTSRSELSPISQLIRKTRKTTAFSEIRKKFRMASLKRKSVSSFRFPSSYATSENMTLKGTGEPNEFLSHGSIKQRRRNKFKNPLPVPSSEGETSLPGSSVLASVGDPYLRHAQSRRLSHVNCAPPRT